MPFKDREEAGRRLGERLAGLRASDPLIVALPRGGVPIAAGVAERLGARLEILGVRKIGAPDNPEYGIGAVTEDGYYWLDEASARETGASQDYLREAIRDETRELNRRLLRYRGDRPRAEFRGRAVVVIDDGLATGVTARAAAAFLRDQGARQVIVAVPVCSPRTARLLRGTADQVICIEEPENFLSVGQFYEDFGQVRDEDVVRALARLAQPSDLREPSATIEDPSRGFSGEVSLPVEPGIQLEGHLTLPSMAHGIVVFAHGSGSSRHSPRNLQVAERLNQAGLGTLLFDLLTPDEAMDRGRVFDIPLLAGRLVRVARWLDGQEDLRGIPLGFFGASTGGGAALEAAAELGLRAAAVVSRGGRPDLALERLPSVSAPTLLIVGGADPEVLDLNRLALRRIPRGELAVVPGATHLFEEPGALGQVADLAARWFTRHFSARNLARAGGGTGDEAA